MDDTQLARTHYFDGQFLRAQDFTNEQHYHLGKSRQHNIAHHTWGIVSGLEIVAEEESLFVQPGVAVDGYGRVLNLAAKEQLPTQRFDEKDEDTLDVWLVYSRIGSDAAPVGYAGCEGNGQAPPYRWQEKPRIRLERPATQANRRQPLTVPPGDYEFAPERVPPDDPTREWPVYLGQIQRSRANPNDPPVYTINPADRPYAGLRGEIVAAPSEQAWLQIGAERVDDPRRFAVFIWDPAESKDTPRLEIDRHGKITIQGDTECHGDLSLRGGAVEFQAGSAQKPDASPWRIYHHVETRQTGNGTTEEGRVEHQLRIEMDAQEQPHSQVVIGMWSAEEELFKPALTVDNDGTVTIHGDLIVKGRINEPPNGQEESAIQAQYRAPAQFSDEAKRLIQAGHLSGVTGANVQLTEFYRRIDEASDGDGDTSTQNGNGAT